MKPTLKPGLTATKTIIIDEPRVIGFMGEDCRVYATPRTISDLEYTCRDFLLAHLDPGEDSVGTKVNWEHVGPALLGEKVTVSIKLIQVEGRRLTFENISSHTSCTSASFSTTQSYPVMPASRAPCST